MIYIKASFGQSPSLKWRRPHLRMSKFLNSRADISVDDESPTCLVNCVLNEARTVFPNIGFTDNASNST